MDWEKTIDRLNKLTNLIWLPKAGNLFCLIAFIDWQFQQSLRIVRTISVDYLEIKDMSDVEILKLVIKKIVSLTEI